MAKVKAGTVSVQLELDKDQFNKDWKAAQREVSSAQKSLQLELERNKVKFAVEGMDKKFDPFNYTVIGKIREARRETQFLNTQIGFQQNKVDVAKAAWTALTATKGATSAAAITAERSFLREQMALVGLQKQLDGTTSASSIMASTMKSTALAAAAAVASMAAAYATAVKSATAWGQAVNDIVDETGMADQEAAKLMGTMNIVGVSSEEATGALAKLARSVNTAAIAQQTANRNGKESEDVFTKWGIAITDSGGRLLSYAEIINNIQSVHRNLSDGMEKTALEMELFGRVGYKLNDFLNLSKEAMDSYAQRLEKMGLVISDSVKYEDLNKQLNEMKLALQGIAVTITGDDIPAIIDLIAKLSELSKWIKENGDGIRDFGQSVLLLTDWVTKPFRLGIDLTVAGLKKYVEAVDAAAKAAKVPVSETDWVQRQAMAAKNAEEAQKKATTAAKARAAAEKDLIFAQRELSDAVAALQGKTLAVTLANIEREREAWAKKTKDEVAATQWAEAAKTKAFMDAMDARLGPEVAAAKKAILEGTNVGDAIYKASQQRRDEERATYEARQQVKKFYGIAEPGDEVRTLQIDSLRNTITQLTEVAKSLTIPKDRYGRTVFDQYQPAPNQQMYTDANGNRTNGIPQGQPGSIFLTVPVTIDGQQVGQAAAKVILPAVQNAVGGNPTAFGGNQ